MARHNANVELSPMKEDQVKSIEDEDEDDADEGGEAVKYLNQAVKLMGKKEARKGNKGPGWFAKKTRSHVEEPHDTPDKVANGDTSSKRTSTSAEDQFMTPPPIPAQPSAPTPPANSEHPTFQKLFFSCPPKRDIYDTPLNEPSQSSPIRAKPSANPKTRQPLVSPKKSNLKGSKLPSPSEHQTRSMYMIETLDADSKRVSDMPLADPKLQNGDAATWGNELPKVVRGKGRPRKNDSYAASSNTALRTSKDQADKGGPQIEHNLQAQEVSDKAVSIGDFEDILDSMLDNPSPLKVGASTKAGESNQNGMSLQNTAPRPVQEIHEVDASEDESLSEEEEIDGVPLEVFKFSEGSNFESKIFGKMLLKVKRVGHTFNVDTQKWAQKKAETKIYSSHGKRLSRQLTYLVQAYLDLRTSKAGGISRNIQKAQSKVDQMVGKVNLEVNDILLDRLGDHGVIKPNTPTILTDLYFNLLPNFVSAIKTAFEVHTMDTIESAITTPTLEELFTLLNLLLKLADKAVAQPKDEQPKTQHSAGYRISKPTREVIPMIREVRDKFSAELGKRRRTKEIARTEKTRVEREKARKLADHEWRLKIQRKKNEIRRLQKKALDEKLADPFCGPWIRGEVARNEAREQARKQEITYKRRNPEAVTSWRRPQASALDVDAEVEPDPFNDEYYDRVRVFGNRNRHESRTTNPFSSEEKAIFIDTMRVERGDDRYEIASDKLQRSMDEIFEIAKDLQEAMDAEHENGRMTETYDEWTYDIWVEQHK